MGLATYPQKGLSPALTRVGGDGVWTSVPNGREHSHCQRPRSWAPKQILSKELPA